jgi:hypothetical protein
MPSKSFISSPIALESVPNDSFFLNGSKDTGIMGNRERKIALEFEVSLWL